MAVTYTRISERNYVYIILEVLSFYFVENTLRTSTIMLQKNVVIAVNRDLKHRQLSGRRRRFPTEADWAKGFVFGGENKV